MKARHFKKLNKLEVIYSMWHKNYVIIDKIRNFWKLKLRIEIIKFTFK